MAKSWYITLETQSTKDNRRLTFDLLRQGLIALVCEKS